MGVFLLRPEAEMPDVPRVVLRVSYVVLGAAVSVEALARVLGARVDAFIFGTVRLSGIVAMAAAIALELAKRRRSRGSVSDRPANR